MNVILVYENHAKPGAWHTVDFSYATETFLEIAEKTADTSILINFDTANPVAFADENEPMKILPPSGKSQPHSYYATQECWYVIDGKAKVIIGNEEQSVEKGDIIYGPEKTTHTLINLSDTETFKALLFLCPDGDERNVTDVLLNNGGVLYEPEKRFSKY